MSLVTEMPQAGPSRSEPSTDPPEPTLETLEAAKSYIAQFTFPDYLIARRFCHRCVDDARQRDCTEITRQLLEQALHEHAPALPLPDIGDKGQATGYLKLHCTNIEELAEFIDLANKSTRYNKIPEASFGLLSQACTDVLADLPPAGELTNSKAKRMALREGLARLRRSGVAATEWAQIFNAPPGR